MKMNPLGPDGVMVSELCLGSMTWGTQTDLAGAHAQMDMALAAGINFVDTAEMYPVNPISADNIGKTEEIIGTWFAANPARRGDVVLATKHSGAGMMHVRQGARISRATIEATIEGSLRRLKTDYIDLYQFHWPNRGSYMFRQNWSYDPTGQDRAATLEHMQEALLVLQAQIDKGNIRQFGLSNESTWGTAMWLRQAQEHGGPRVVSMQNEYSLMCRLYDTDMAELSHHERVGLLAFSPLATGLLTGKYQDQAMPEGSRMTLAPELGGRNTPRAFQAVSAYLQVARDFDLDPVHMALAWVCQRPFTCSAIFGATTLAQLSHVLDGAGLVLSDAVLARLDQVHRDHPMPY